MTALISVRNLQVAFQMGKAHRSQAVKGVSFDIPENQTMALVGESGSGKTVTAMSIVRLLPENALTSPESEIRYKDHDLLKASSQALRTLRGKEISMVFQEPMSSLNPVFMVGEQISEVLRLHLGLNSKQALDRATELMTEVGIDRAAQRLKAYPHELSGGQQQRVMIAMAIACEPALLIADEPTTALDVTVQRQIIDLLKRIQERRRMSILFISHDLGLVGEIADQVVVMRHGVVREAGPVRDIFFSPKDAYTKALLACRPKLDARPYRLPVIEDFMGDKPVTSSRREAVAIAAEPLIEVKGLSKDYLLKNGLFSRSVLHAVKPTDFSLYKGRTLGVVGESGSGKTTLGMMLARLTSTTQGSIVFSGVDLAQLSSDQLKPYRSRIQIIFQNPYASLNPRFSVGQILMEPMRIQGIGANDDERAMMALRMIERVGLDAESFGKYPHEFSGGQRQRIAIARCLTLKPEVIVCDESVSALDVSVQATVLNLLLDLQEEFGLTYVFISHDLAVVKYMSDEILVMSEGEIVEHGNAEVIYANPAHPYTRKLLSAIPRGLQAAAAN